MDRDIAAVCLIPPGNVAREIAALKRRIFEATGEARVLALPEAAILLSMPWEPGLGNRDGRRRIKAVFESAWECMEGRFRLAEPMVVPGWLVLSMGKLPSAMMERLSSAWVDGEPSAASPFPTLPSFPLHPIRDEAGDLAATAEAGPPELAFGAARLALLRFRLSGGTDGFEAVTWKGIVAVRRRTGPRMADDL
jgi:hypothetical protein